MPSIGIVGATGAVGRVAIALLRERGHEDVRLFASGRSSGTEIDGTLVEEATPDTLRAGGLDVVFFAIGTEASRELVPHAVAGGATVVDKSSAYRLQDGVPLVVPEVNGERALEHDGVVANPNCCSIPLTCVLKPLHDEAGVRRVRLATYQSASGAGTTSMERLRATSTADTDLAMDWNFDGEEFDEEAKIRDETRKILELPQLPVHAQCMRVPVMVGHAEAVWVETEAAISPDDARRVLSGAPSVRLVDLPTPKQAEGIDDVLVGRIRRDVTEPNGLSLLVVCDNLRKGAALNAIQIAELLLERRRVAA